MFILVRKYCSLLLLFILGVFFSTTPLYAQSIDNISALLKNLTKQSPAAFHHASMGKIHWISDPSQTNYLSLGLQTALNISNVYRFLTTTESIGDILSEERIGMDAAISIRAKYWNYPFDVGLHILPILISPDVYFLSVGTDVRYTILEERFPYIPSVSVGWLYNYSHLFFSYTLDGAIFNGIDKADSTVRIKINDIVLTARSQVHSIATRIQVQKTFNFIVPFIGLEPSLFISVFDINTNSAVEISRDSGASYTKQTEFNILTKAFLEKKYLLYHHIQAKAGLNTYVGTNIMIGKSQCNITLGVQPINTAINPDIDFSLGATYTISLGYAYKR